MTRFGIAALALLGLTSCGGLFYDGPSGSVTQAQFEDEIESRFFQSVRGLFDRPKEAPGPLFRAAPDFTACTTKDPATTTDADGDGIPLTYKETYACDGITDNSITYSYTGSYTATDKDDAKKDGGYRYDYDNIKSTSAMTGVTEESTSTGFHELTKEGAAYTYTSDFQVNGSQNTTARVAGTIAWTYGSSWTHTMTPDDANDPLAGGSIEMTGSYGHKVSDTTNTANNFEVVFGIKSTNLKYDATGCSNYYKSGSIELTDGANNKITIEYTDCSTKTCKFNDTAFNC